MLGAHAEDAASARRAQLDVGDGLGIGAVADGVLVIGDEGVALDAGLAQGVEQKYLEPTKLLRRDRHHH